LINSWKERGAGQPSSCGIILLNTAFFYTTAFCFLSWMAGESGFGLEGELLAIAFSYTTAFFFNLDGRRERVRA
jgi:hypothetical protein